MHDLSGARILMTGGNGFLGKHVQNVLRARGVTDICTPRKDRYDLTQRADVDQLFEEVAPDVVLHLAARVGGIGANMSAPASLYLDNLLMGTYVIEAARHAGTAKTVILGTICAYPKFTPVPFREEALWDGYPEETNAPYGIAKKALLVHAQANREQHGQNCIYLLPVNLYGPGDKFHPSVSHVIPALIRKFVLAAERGERAVEVWGSGTATREFLYVTDAAEAIVAATERYDGPDPVNIGSGQEISVSDLAELVAKLTGFEGDLVWDPSKPDGQPRRGLDTTRAERHFGFRARTSLEDGLRITIDWYRANREAAEAATW